MAEEARYNEKQIADALAAELGIEDRGDQNDSETNDFFRYMEQNAPDDDSAEELVAPKAPKAEAPAEEEKFVYDYDGVHKEFNTREELLAYESGRKSNEIGELRARLEAYEKLVEGAKDAPPQQMDPSKQEEMIFQAAMKQAGVDLDQVDPGAYKTIWKIFEAGLGMYDQGVVNKRFSDLQGTVEKITTRAQEAEALNAAGITAQQVKQALEKHPSLKALAPGERVAVIADLVQREAPQKGTGESPNALRQALQKPSASGHVEGSVGSAPPDDYESHLEAELFKLDDRARLSAISQMFEKSDVGMRIKDAHI